MNTPKDIFTRIHHFLYSEFTGAEISFPKSIDLEDSIGKKIEQLKKNRFFVGFGDNLSSVEVSLDEITDMFITLRRQKIDFYRAILEEYKKNKSHYDKELGIMD